MACPVGCSPRRLERRVAWTSALASATLKLSDELGLHLVHDAAEGSRVVDGQLGQHLAVDLDRRLLHAGHELAVGDAEFARGRVDARDPQLAKHTLARAPIAVGILARLHHRLLGDAEDVLAAASETLGLFQDLLVACVGGDAAFDARHVRAPSCGSVDHRPEKGNIAATWPMLVSCTAVAPRRWRLRVVDFFVRMWRLYA